ncbi:MAG: carboxypeptidase-like regulatory domain-containing protein [Lutibacter sp.]|nr:carboxypeptidase-like regulatory domain-containing protein [Lutibacter sp.]
MKEIAQKYVGTFFLFSALSLCAQTPQDSLVAGVSKAFVAGAELHGAVYDTDRESPLPYTTVYALRNQKGVVSNEQGHFSFDLTGLYPTDTLAFQYVGYQVLKYTVADLQEHPEVYLQEAVVSLSEALVFSGAPDPETIVQRVLKNRAQNYPETNLKSLVFARRRYLSDIDRFKLDYKKSSIASLNRGLFTLLEEKIPRHSTSFTDFLGDLYLSADPNDTLKLKTAPIQTVSLKEKDVAELSQLEPLFDSIFNKEDPETYWKFKTGIFGTKVTVENEGDKAANDSLAENSRKVSEFSAGIGRRIAYATFEDKKTWEFLYKTGRYTYNLAGGTFVNGEAVYIIDFSPRGKGKFQGRMYIAAESYALIRVDYSYAPEKTGEHFKLLGFLYTEYLFSVSIYFERYQDRYHLTYISLKNGSQFGVKRNISLIKKRKRALFDKKIEQVKVRLDMRSSFESSFELLVLDRQAISPGEFADFIQPERMEVIYVDQFDDTLWEGFSIIAPTQQMKDYKKRDTY